MYPVGRLLSTTEDQWEYFLETVLVETEGNILMIEDERKYDKAEAAPKLNRPWRSILFRLFYLGDDDSQASLACFKVPRSTSTYPEQSVTFVTHECPNIFVQTNLTQTNVRIYS